ncbi:hypothetical protein LO749_07730 [Paracoccus denitrificans]|nr:hypothetical protein [Paracoccus denitrificans]UFS64060.1 hypothetical protein LO749_07730 [Paracoccus denitrificans]
MTMQPPPPAQCPAAPMAAQDRAPCIPTHNRGRPLGGRARIAPASAERPALPGIDRFLRRHSGRQGRDPGHHAPHCRPMVPAEPPKDIAQGRRDLPQSRGAQMAGRTLPALPRQSRAGLSAWYQDIQTRLMTGRVPGVARTIRPPQIKARTDKDSPEASQ